jgi:L-amino acid N-acyltransferase
VFVAVIPPDEIRHGRPQRVGKLRNIITCDRTWSPQILEILNEVIANSTALYDYYPRKQQTMTAWFDTKESASYPVIGVVEGATLLGFASYSAFRAWPAYKYTIEHSVYVNAAHRRQGIGAVLLGALIEEARRQDYRNMIGGIDADNAPSIALHIKLGFVRCGLIKDAGFKFGRWLDLCFYQLLLDGPSQPMEG